MRVQEILNRMRIRQSQNHARRRNLGILFLVLVIPVFSTSPSQNSPKIYDFEKLSSLKKRLEVLEEASSELLSSFYEPRLKSFSVKPGGAQKQRVCVTSSCYALLTLTIYPDQAHANNSLIPIRRVMKTLLATEPRKDDLFQVPLLIYTLLKVDSDRSIIRAAVDANPNTAERLQKMLQSVVDARPHRSAGTRQEHSDYINYQVCKVVANLHDATPVPSTEDTAVGGLPASALPPNCASLTFWALMRCAEVSSNELCRQLAYRTAGDSNSFDVIRLAYSLLTYLRSAESLSGIAGREMVPGQGPSPETKMAPLNKRLVAAALDAFFQEQKSDGLWDKGEPIYKSFRGGKDRNMGSAFVFPVNTVGSLLCALPAEDFRPHLRALENTLNWIESHQKLEIVADHLDPESGICYGKPIRGWSSPHMNPDSGPMAWPTAQVLKCVSWMKNRIQELMHKDVLEEFKGIAFSEKGIQPEKWDQLLDSDIGDPFSDGKTLTIKSVLEERVVNPFADSIDNPSYGAAYSGIFFGPPGTAKTSLCEALAQRMGYDFVVIDTGSFLTDGLSNVSARIRYVFSRLMALKKCVILVSWSLSAYDTKRFLESSTLTHFFCTLGQFDEIEEFALDRETPGISMESRMLTTALLTCINDLRRNQKSIFFIATNRLKAFDSAITRPGRFDMQLFVGTPNLESRIIQFHQAMSKNKVTDSEQRDAATNVFRLFLESVWLQDAMFMNYIESMQFASACAGIVASGAELTPKSCADILRQQAAVMTVRGAAREEYISSMELSRL